MGRAMQQMQAQRAGQGGAPAVNNLPRPGGGPQADPMLQRQMAQAQQMRGGGRGGWQKPQRPPNPGGSRMPMRGGMRGGGRGMY